MDKKSIASYFSKFTEQDLKFIFNKESWNKQIKPKLLNKLAFTTLATKSSVYTLQGLMLPVIRKWVEFNIQSAKSVNKNYFQHLQQALPKIQSLFENEAYNIQNGIYPIQVLKPDFFLNDFIQYPLILKDAFRAAKQRIENNHNVFDEEVTDQLKELPEYYQRNFHFQNNGYLSDQSAQLYQQQVEILFAGAAASMRRICLPSLRKLFDKDAKIKILELGAGTGALTLDLVKTFPNAKITAIDLSDDYLNFAKKKLSKNKNVYFMNAAAEDLPFKEESFDLVVSCFLFHELPIQIREKVIQQSWTVLKKQGVFSLVDSLQWDDDPDFNWALQSFPIDFHEPFYTNYIKNPMDVLIEKTAPFKIFDQRIGFLAKTITVTKKISS